MSGESYKPLPATHSDFALLLASAATERAALSQRMQEAARIIDGLSGPMLRSFARGLAEVHRSNAEAEHRLARAFEALAAESGEATEPDTKRDIEVARRNHFMSTLRIVCMAVGGGLVAGAATVGLATAFPKIALIMLAVGGTVMGLGTNLPGGQSLPARKEP